MIVIMNKTQDKGIASQPVLNPINMALFTYAIKLAN